MPDPPVRDFTFETRALRVVFGPGASERIAAALEPMGTQKALLVTTSGGASRFPDLLRALGPRLGGVFDGARAHVPGRTVSAAVDAAVRAEADVLVAVGGGSAIGTVKAAALQTGLPIAAVPTTYSGSEMTSIWGIRDGAEKRTGRDGRAAPRMVVYDPRLTASLPPGMSAASGMNAIAHCVEAIYARDGSPVASLLAEEGARALARSLPRIVRRPADQDARSQALYGAYLAGNALEATSMGLHHKLCHVLGGMYDLPHALTHAILLPHVTGYNAPYAPEAMERLERALEGPPALALFELNGALGITRTLRDLGLGPHELDAAAEAAIVEPYANPAPVTRDSVRAVLEAAWWGKAPPSHR